MIKGSLEDTSELRRLDYQISDAIGRDVNTKGLLVVLDLLCGKKVDFARNVVFFYRKGVGWGVKVGGFRRRLQHTLANNLFQCPTLARRKSPLSFKRSLQEL